MSEELKLKKGLDLELDEAKATGEDSESADPVTPEGGIDKKRKADKKTAPEKAEAVKEEEEVEAPALAEAFVGLFEGQELSEEFKTKTVAVFEAAVHEKVLAEKAALAEQFEADLQEQVATAVEDIVEKVDSYLDYVVENWMAANEVAIESNLKLQVAESLMDGLKGLVSEHNLEISEETVDAVAEVEAKLEESTAKYNEVVEQMMALREEKEQLELAAAFRTVAEGLTETQADKLGVLAEGVTFESVEDYAKKLVAIKESYFTESVVAKEDATEYLEEEVVVEAKAPQVDPAIAAYVDSISRFVK